MIERDARIPDSYVAGLAELGCFGLKVPVEYGGLGLSQVAYNRALMVVSSVHRAWCPAVGPPVHRRAGTAEARRHRGAEAEVPAALREGRDLGVLLTEPDVGSDPPRLASTATPTEDGSAYILDGVKLWTTNGVVAELLVVMARVPRREGKRGGISAFVVEADAPEITVERRNAFMGLRGIENGVTR